MRNDTLKVVKSYGGTVTRSVAYYPVGGAMRVNGTLYYMVSINSTRRLKDHLGSANVITDPGVDDPTATNQAGWFGRTYQYSATIPHAVVSVTSEQSSVDSYEYDANGNMICRVENGVTFKQDYNAENRISAIHKMNGTCSTGSVTESWLYAYDGDGVRVVTAHYTGVTQDWLTSYYMGGAYEVTGAAVKKYYSIAGQTIMKDSDGSLKYLLTDHLGSTSAVVDQNGNPLGQQRYLPFGEKRTGLNPPYMDQTDLTYTGQRDLPGTGVMDYDARFYSPSLGRFLQADSVVSNGANPQAWNRFSYVSNRSIIMNDPSGHYQVVGGGGTNTASCAEPPTDKAKKIMDTLIASHPFAEGDYMTTYTIASLGVQNPRGKINSIKQGIAVKLKGDDASQGLGKITNNEMNTDYGTAILNTKGEKTDNYGLGMKGEDQNDDVVAFKGMGRRIQVRLDICNSQKIKCTPTDIFLASALGGDAAISPDNVRNLGRGTKDIEKPDPATGIFQWDDYLEGPIENRNHDYSVIKDFVDNVTYLQSQGAYIPDEVDLEYVCDLIPWVIKWQY